MAHILEVTKMNGKSDLVLEDDTAGEWEQKKKKKEYGQTSSS